LATNLLIELVGAKNVNQTMRDIGAKDIQVLRGVEDNKAFKAGLNNTTTAYDLLLIFEKLAKNQMLSKENHSKMIDILKSQKFNEIIPAKLPKGTVVAHKTGSITGVQHDSGIIYLPNGKKYVLVLLSKNLKSEKEGVELLSKISEIIYQMH
jgi:beta-lactamase class A